MSSQFSSGSAHFAENSKSLLYSPSPQLDLCHGPRIKKGEEGQRERRQVRATLGRTVGKLRRQNLGKGSVSNQDGMFTEQRQVQMQEPKSKISVEVKEGPYRNSVRHPSTAPAGLCDNQLQVLKCLKI